LPAKEGNISQDVAIIVDENVELPRGRRKELLMAGIAVMGNVKPISFPKLWEGSGFISYSYEPGKTD